MRSTIVFLVFMISFSVSAQTVNHTFKSLKPESNKGLLGTESILKRKIVQYYQFSECSTHIIKKTISPQTAQNEMLRIQTELSLYKWENINLLEKIYFISREIGNYRADCMPNLIKLVGVDTVLGFLSQNNKEKSVPSEYSVMSAFFGNVAKELALQKHKFIAEGKSSGFNPNNIDEMKRILRLMYDGEGFDRSQALLMKYAAQLGDKVVIDVVSRVIDNYKNSLLDYLPGYYLGEMTWIEEVLSSFDTDDEEVKSDVQELLAKISD